MSDSLPAGDRLRRLLAVLAYLARVGEARLDDLAERFDIDPKVLVSELELAACCGLPPYTPDQLLELVLDDETVRAYGLEALRRPPRLTPEEGFALAASARSLLAIRGSDGSGPLATALGKLEQALGADRVHVELEAPEHLGELRRAAADGLLVEIDYLGAKRGDETTRIVAPYAVVAREGRFYLDAYCHLAADWRRFQVDRVVEVRSAPGHDPIRVPPAELSGERAFVGGGSTRLARIAVPAGRDALLERFAVGSPERLEDGRVVFSIEVADEHWFGRLLLRLGPDVEILEPAELAQAAAEVAQRALLRYDRKR
ncbi:MAG: transcriptional regulator protein-like protein [Acidimicrobiaceae bacterium]|nr:transcriptional regulator protein-like protein [Acidimicrobiaceae bacterium]